jgi:hypothetical protein
MYNHNHYKIGDSETPETAIDILPEHFRAHLIGFAQADADMHAGKPKFLNDKNAKLLATEYTDWFSRTHIQENKVIKGEEREIWIYKPDLETERSSRNAYTDYDREEHLEGQNMISCRDDGKPLIESMRGGRSDRADDRQPADYNDPNQQYVIEARIRGYARDQEIKDVLNDLDNGKEMGATRQERSARFKELENKPSRTVSEMMELGSITKIERGYQALDEYAAFDENTIKRPHVWTQDANTDAVTPKQQSVTALNVAVPLGSKNPNPKPNPFRGNGTIKV